MAKRFGFFNSINGDRKYLASDLSTAFDIGTTSGLKADREDNFQVLPHENMTVKMLPGGAMIFGHYLLDDEEELITLELSDGELNRIDRVVLRYDKYERSVKTVVTKGTLALNPTPPAPLRTAEQFDLVLADIRVNAATTEITASNITDMRESDLCGFIGVKGAVSQIDFDAHLAENVAQVIRISRSLDLLGTQSIATLPGKKIKGVIAKGYTVSVSFPAHCILFAAKDSVSVGNYTDATSGAMGNSSSFIFSKNNRNDRAFGEVKINNESIDINWSNPDGDFKHDVYIELFVFYHD